MNSLVELGANDLLLKVEFFLPDKTRMVGLEVLFLCFFLADSNSPITLDYVFLFK